MVDFLNYGSCRRPHSYRYYNIQACVYYAMCTCIFHVVDLCSSSLFQYFVHFVLGQSATLVRLAITLTTKIIILQPYIMFANHFLVHVLHGLEWDGSQSRASDDGSSDSSYSASGPLVEVEAITETMMKVRIALLMNGNMAMGLGLRKTKYREGRNSGR